MSNGCTARYVMALFNSPLTNQIFSVGFIGGTFAICASAVQFEQNAFIKIQTKIIEKEILNDRSPDISRET